jgi:dihydroorotate dehydrogenase electron transfer subunit
MKYKELCPIIEKKITGSYLTLKIRTEHIAQNAKPGQFVNIRVTETLDPLLRRPISICDAEGDILTLMVLIKGRGTKLLAGKQEGDSINIIGPLGNGFQKTDRKAIFTAGGIGIAPFLFLSKQMKGSILLVGARNSELMPDTKPFEKYSKVFTATDDGSSGRKGTVIDLLADYNLSEYCVYACGPAPMFRAVSKLLRNCSSAEDRKSDVQFLPGTAKKLPEAFYSLETYMGCGFGACKGCTVETAGGDYKLSCTDGPVFKWNEVKL